MDVADDVILREVDPNGHSRGECYRKLLETLLGGGEIHLGRGTAGRRGERQPTAKISSAYPSTWRFQLQAGAVQQSGFYVALYSPGVPRFLAMSQCGGRLASVVSVNQSGTGRWRVRVEEVATMKSQFASRLRALLAPVAQNKGSAIDDPALLEVATKVVDAFMQGDTTGGLSRAQIVGRINGTVAEAVLESRLSLFVEMGMLNTFHGRKHEQRYRLNSISAVGLLVYERLQERGGMDELRTLLDRTRRLLKGDYVDRDAVATEISKLTGLLNVFADELQLLTASAPLSVLLAERRLHDHGDLLRDVREVNGLVTEHAPNLDHEAVTLIGAAQRYLDAVQDLVQRVYDDGGETRDFSVLEPEAYFAAAKTATVEQLAAVFDGAIFDAPSLHFDTTELAEYLEESAPTSSRRIRPPEPAPSEEDDPLAVAEARRAELTERRFQRAEQLLDGHEEAELTGWMISAGWRGTAETLADLAALDTNREQPYTIETSDAVLVSRDAEPTLRSPTSLHADRPEIAADQEPDEQHTANQEATDAS